MGLLLGMWIHTPLANANYATASDLTTLERLQQKDVELLKQQIESAKETQKTDAASLTQQINSVNKRVDDQLAQVGVYLTIYGVMVTVLLVGMGFVANRQAKSDARQVATDWFEENTEMIVKKVADVEKKANEAHQAMDRSAKEIEDLEQEIRRRYDRMSEGMDAGVQGRATTPLSPADQVVIEKAAKRIKSKPENQYTFDDWSSRAFAALDKQDHEEAAWSFLKASQAQDATDQQKANSLLGRAFMFDRLGRPDAVLQVYDEVLRRYGEAKELALQEPVAKALVNKGFTLGDLGRHEEAIAVYDEVLRRYGEAKELALQELVANALVNKGITLGDLGRHEEAIQVCDELLRRYGEAKELALQEQVAKAFNGLGFTLLMAAKRHWLDRDLARLNLDLARKHLERALAIRPMPSNGMVLGNLAYVLYLLGDAAQAQTTFDVALRAQKLGGKSLYEGILKDLEQCPIEPDAGMRELVEAAWQRYQGDQGPAETT